MKFLSKIAILLIFTFAIFTKTATQAEEIGGIEFPLGQQSFADAVVSFAIGPDSATTDPTVALGLPSDPPEALSLGNQGVLVVEFVDNLLVDQDNAENGLDLFVFEAGASAMGATENFLIEISKDDVNYINLGEFQGETLGVDIKPFVEPGDVFRYVRITDLEPNNTPFPTAGADIDAVGAIGSIPAPQTRKVYWTDLTNDRIQRANLDGSNVENIISQGLEIPIAMTVDAVDQKIYWSDEGNDSIKRANFDGSNVELILPVFSEVSGIAVDSNGGKLYYANRSPGEIRRCNLDGSNVEFLTNVGNARHMAFSGGRIYWTEEGADGLVRSASHDGTDIQNLASAVEPRGVAVDIVAGKVYWVDNGGPMTTSVIRRCNLDGTENEDIISTGLGAPQGMAIDSDSGQLYWTDLVNDTITRANLDGTGIEDVVTSGLIAPSGIAIANVQSSFLLGDVNLDGVVDLLDVEPFIDLISGSGFQFEADINGDGLVNLLDVNPFVNILVGN